MTAEQRERVRRARDARARARVLASKLDVGCRTCGCDYDSHTKHCPSCWVRHYERKLRRLRAERRLVEGPPNGTRWETERGAAFNEATP
jgi:hypothetical protein